MKDADELLEIYDLSGNLLELKKRKDFYQEIEQEYADTGKITKKVKSIRVMLMTSDGRLYLQRRSLLKEQNRGLYDKTIGGHFMSGHTWELTVVKEMIEELAIPSAVLSEKDFSIALASTDTSIIGIFKEIDHDADFESTRTTDAGIIVQPYITTFYVGYYDGSIRFKDGEASGIEVHSLAELDASIQEYPNKYTEDLKVMVERYREHLVPAKELLTK